VKLIIMKKQLIHILFCTLPGMAMAQTDLQNTGTLYISTSSDILYVNGAFTNGGTLTNHGQLYVLRNLTNNEASMAAGTGSLLLTGTLAQIVGGTQPFRTFNLTTNNAAGITLNNNLHVSGTHTFTNGIIASSATPNYLVYESGSSYTGSGDAAHVSGWVKKIGSTNFAFPVGNGTYERPVSVVSLSAASEFNARHNVNTPNTNSMLSPIVSVDPYEYWTINQVSGGTAQLFMNWNNAKIQFPQYILADIRAIYNNAGVWENRGGTATGNVATTGTITSNAVSAFGNFTMGSVSVALPVEFLGIWAMAGDGYNTIQFKTAQESNIDHFEVQRSPDAITFLPIGRMPPHNTNDPQLYTFKDAQPLSGTAWYRVRNIDIDGQSKYSPIVKLSAGNRASSFHVMNNPVSAVIYMSASDNYKGNYQYQLLSNLGQVVQTGNVVVQQAGIVSIPLKDPVSRGVFLLHVYNPKHQLVEKIIVK
jgi:hypothetical protein